jgi:hypothetical protein
VHGGGRRESKGEAVVSPNSLSDICRSTEGGFIPDMRNSNLLLNPQLICPILAPLSKDNEDALHKFNGLTL